MRVKTPSIFFLLIAIFLFLGAGLLRSASKANSSATYSEVSLANGNGYGSTGIYARTFTTVITDQGTKITYRSDPVDGDSFTVNADGLYAVSYTDGDPAVDNVGISRNLAPTSPFSSVWGTGQELCEFETANSAETCSVVTHLNRGDVIRAANEFGGPPPNDQPVARFTITALP
jgi:hypothetical protein